MKIGFSNPLLAISHQRFRLPNLALALKWVLCLMFVSCFTNVTIAQPKRPPSTAQIEDPNKQIAHILFEQNEFAKATILLEDIVNADPSDELSYNRYMICLVKLGEQDKAIKWIKKRIKKAENPLSYVVDECWINTTYPESTDKIKHTQRADELLQLIIDQLENRAQEQMGASHFYVANRFEQHGLKNFSISVLQAAEKYWAKSLKSQTSWPCFTWKRATAKRS